MFSQFALHERLLKAVAELKFVEPTPVQQAAIPPALEGRDLRVTARTGSGKTAAFVLPLLNRLIGEAKPRERIRSLILLPTRELAQQTLKEVERFSQFTFIKSGLVTGGEDFKVQAAMLRKLPDVLVSTPGRLIEHLNSGTVSLKEVEVLVLDEADRMLDMGFAEDMQRITAECANRQQTLLFSATTGGAALREVSAQVLKDPLHLRLNGIEQLNESTRQQVITADDVDHKEALARWLLANETYQKAIVFTNTRAQADRFYGHLVAAGYKAFVLHGDKDQKDRKLAIDRVREGGTKVLVATDVAARGLDIHDLPQVVNLDLPIVAEDYVHRIGRTGRAGATGEAVSLVCADEVELLSAIEVLIRQTLERREEPGFEPDHRVPVTDASGAILKKPKKPKKPKEPAAGGKPARLGNWIDSEKPKVKAVRKSPGFSRGKKG